MPKLGVYWSLVTEDEEELLLVKATNETLSVTPDDGLERTYRPLRTIKEYFNRPYVRRSLVHFASLLKEVQRVCIENSNRALWDVAFEEGKRLPFQVLPCLLR